jgi:AcrR family transcriptional regulator
MYVNRKIRENRLASGTQRIARIPTGRSPVRIMAEKVVRSKSEQRAATRRRLVKLAREEFARRGYAGAATERIVARAKLTRGALYHQFEDKQALFQAVYEDVQREINEQIDAAVAQAADDWSALSVATRAFLKCASDPALQRIVLIDGPAVLGWNERRHLDSENCVSDIRAALAGLMDCGIIERRPLDSLAYIVFGAMTEAALWITSASAEDRQAALDEAAETMDALFAGLRCP